MAIGDFINSVTDAVKNCTPDLTSVYGYTSSTISKVGNAVKNYTPDLTSVYGYSSSTVSKVDNAVRANVGPKLSEYLPDDEGRAKIGRVARDFGKNAVVLGVHEGAKCVPGGSLVHQIIMRSLPNEKNENLTNTVKTLESRIAMLEKQAIGSGKSNDRAEISGSDIKKLPSKI